jgi:GntR family transcriptional regulator
MDDAPTSLGGRAGEDAPAAPAEPQAPSPALEPLSSGPLAERVRAAILDAIIKKQFVDKLPSEDALGDMLKVSRTTIRTALHSLEQEGIVTRRRAIGTTINAHVRPSALALQRLVGFADMLAEKGYDVRVEADQWRTVAPPDVVAAFPGEFPEGDTLMTSRRFFADGHLAISLRDAVPWSNLKSAEMPPEEPDPWKVDFSRAYCRRPVDHAVVEILAKVASNGTATEVVEDGEAFCRLLERHYTSDGELMAVSIIDVDSDYVRFEVVRRQ